MLIEQILIIMSSDMFFMSRIKGIYCVLVQHVDLLFCIEPFNILFTTVTLQTFTQLR